MTYRRVAQAVCRIVVPLSLLAAITAAAAPTTGGSARRDGSHDFDFNLGVWHTQIKVVKNPFEGGTQAMELSGTVTVRGIWDGRAQLEEIEADGPNGHWEALTLFLYNPTAHQWSASFINAKLAALNAPMVGSFVQGHGEFFNHDVYHDKSILVRGTWSNITSDSHTYEEDYSKDGGRSWSPAFVGRLTRESAAPTSNVAAGAPALSAETSGREFDFDLGVWRTHSSRLLHPLTGSKQWVQMDGITTVRKVWSGRANLAEYKASGSGEEVELLSLRWFNPSTHEWNIDFANPKGGSLGIAAAGEFRNGRADFYDYEQIDGRSVLVRFSIWQTSADSAESEQAFSEDGGKTWEVNWVNHYTRETGT